MTWLAYSHLGVAKRLTLDTQPGGALAGIPFVSQPVGRLLDGSGVLSRTTGTVVTVSKLSGVGTLSGTLTAVTVEGVFTFTDLKMDTVTGAVTLSFASSGLTSATSSAFNVTQPNTTIGCEVGSYVVTGAAQTLTRGPYLLRPFAAGSYAITGTAVTLTYTSGANPNEPSGYTTYVDEPFNSLPLSGYAIGGTPVLSSDATAPISPSSVIQAYYPSSYAAGSAPWVVEKSLSAHPSELYYHYTMFHSANFVGQSSQTNKIGFAWVNEGADIFFSAEGSGSDPLEAQFRLQGVPDSRGRLRPNLGTTTQQTIFRGVWNDLEVQVILNTPGVANGIARWWLNGVHIGEYTDVQYCSGAEARELHYATLNPIWGGTGGTPGVNMYINFDYWYVSGKV